jgi:pSer/pThr/pTyr-binding forkhead associated (FHA) protein
MSEVYLWRLGPHDRQGHPGAPLAITRLPCVVGRHSGCDLRLDDPLVSRWHCALEWRDGRVWVEDLQSLNGTLLNGESLDGPRPVEDFDLLQVGSCLFLVRLAGADVRGTDLRDGDAGEAGARRQAVYTAS